MNFKIYLIHHLKQWPTGRKIGECKNRFLEDNVFLKVLRRQRIKNCFFCSYMKPPSTKTIGLSEIITLN